MTTATEALRDPGCPACRARTSGDCGAHGVRQRQSPTRTSVILAEITRQLDERRQHIDEATDLGELRVTVRLNAGTVWIRSVSWEEQRCRSRT
jgi:hypothetical protein